MKRFFLGGIVGLITGVILAANGLALAGQDIKLIVNGKEIQCDVPPQEINGRVLVPARFLAEALGAKVDWDGERNAVVVVTGQGNEMPTQTSSEDWISLNDLADKYGVFISGGDNVTIRKGEKQVEFPRPAYQGKTTIISVAPSFHVKIENARFYLSKNELRQAGFIL
ncbi:MAG: copper amine oxidase N-terminal domain-containing protein [Firmicutes bacterium]|nr:copper amine oxidase N-terminal domain-containing protein [Bacillota bacterium]